MKRMFWKIYSCVLILVVILMIIGAISFYNKKTKELIVKQTNILNTVEEQLERGVFTRADGIKLKTFDERYKLLKSFPYNLFASHDQLIELNTRYRKIQVELSKYYNNLNQINKIVKEVTPMVQQYALSQPDVWNVSRRAKILLLDYSEKWVRIHPEYSRLPKSIRFSVEDSCMTIFCVVSIEYQTRKYLKYNSPFPVGKSEVVDAYVPISRIIAIDWPEKRYIGTTIVELAPVEWRFELSYEEHINNYYLPIDFNKFEKWLINLPLRNN